MIGQSAFETGKPRGNDHVPGVVRDAGYTKVGRA